MEIHIFASFLYLILSGTVIKANSATETRHNHAPLVGVRRAVSASNNGGCPPLPSNCNYECLTLGQDGCVQCTCTKQGSTGAGSLTGGSTLTSSGTGNQTSTGAGSLTGGGTLTGSGAGNLNFSGGSFYGSGSGGAGIPGNPFGNSSALGNPLQPGGPGSLYGGNGTTGLGNTGMGSLTGGSSLTSSGTNITANTGSLNNFFSGKLDNTLKGNNSFSSTGNVFTMGSVSGNQGTVAQASMNNNGCPSFPSNCGSTCVTLDSNGCPICTCTASNNSSSPFSSSHSFGGSVSGQTSAQASQNLNGCPAFANDCSAECVSLNSIGCPICTCHNAGSHSSQSSGHHSGSSSNANGCPTFYSSCPASCVTLDSLGCPICTCNATAGSGSASSSHTSGTNQNHGPTQNNNGCPLFPTNCRSECASLDSRSGCPICTCTSASGNVTNSFTGGSSFPNSYNQPGSGNAQQANGCPQFPSNCAGSCTTINDRGCPVCTCSVPAVSPTVSQTECPPTVAGCDTKCLWEDRESCIRCNTTCNDILKSSSGPTTTSSSGGIQTTIKPTTAGAPECPPFDQHCSMSCVSLDGHGCIVCSCPAATTTTTPKPITTTPIKTTPKPTTVSVLPTSSSTASHVTICKAFDPANCRVDCLAMDIKGCLICICGTSSSSTAAPSPLSSSAPPVVTTTPGSRSTVAPSTSGQGPVTTYDPTMATGSGTVSPNGCSAFDPSCPVECAAVDAVGCLHCSCPKTNNTTSTGSGSSGPSVGGPGKNNGCPVFDTSCAPGCAQIDAMGCLHCTCTGTTVSSGTGSSGSSGTSSGTGSGGFPGSGSGGFPNTGTGTSSGSGSIGFPGSGGSGFPGSGSGSFPGSGGSGLPGSGCPAVDVMSCQPSCLVYQNGCVLCTCTGSTAGTTPVHTGVPTQPPSTTIHPVIEITQQTNTASSSTVHPVIEITRPTSSTTTTTRHPVIEITMATKNPLGKLPTTTSKPTTVTTQAQVTTARVPQTTSHAPGVCPPIRCLYPCDLGVSLGSDNCPVCKCRADATTTRP